MIKSLKPTLIEMFEKVNKLKISDNSILKQINEGIDDIRISVFGLAKSNNGLFKSEKQRDFLISQLKNNDGFIGHADSGYNSAPIFASYDDKGITKIIKSTKNGDVPMFERSVDGQLNNLQSAELIKWERKLKMMKKELSDRINSYENGSYNGSGDKSTYTDDMIQRYLEAQKQKEIAIADIENKINILKKS